MISVKNFFSSASELHRFTITLRLEKCRMVLIHIHEIMRNIYIGIFQKSTLK